MIWKKYEKCNSYMESKGYVRKSNLYWNMYLGNQWYTQRANTDLKDSLPVVNFIEPVVNYKVSTLCKKSMIASFSDTEGRAELNDIYGMLNDHFKNSWKKAGMDFVLWKAVKASAVVGDTYLYFYSNDTSDVQLLPNVNVLLGDELNPEIQEQPYLMIRERVTVETVQAIAKLNGIPEEKWVNLTGDDNDDYLTVNRDDVENDDKYGKLTSVIYFEKKDGIVHVARSVDGLVYEPLHPIKGMRLYPIVNMIWQDKPNSARGQGEVVKLIPNQVEVNKTYARRSVAVRMYSFPKLAYNTNAITNPEDLDKVGAAIGMNGTAESVNQAIAYLNPAMISSDAKNLSDDLMQTSRDLAGAGDTSMGQIDPTRVSGTAIVAIQEQAALALNEQGSKSKRVVEDVAKLWYEMWMVYTDDRFGLKIRRKATDEERMTLGVETVPDLIKKSQLEELKPEVRIDVSENTQWAISDRQTALDNLLSQSRITYAEYLEDLEEDGVLPKSQLLKQLKMRPEGSIVENGNLITPIQQPIQQPTQDEEVPQ